MLSDKLFLTELSFEIILIFLRYSPFVPSQGLYITNTENFYSNSDACLCVLSRKVKSNMYANILFMAYDWKTCNITKAIAYCR